jgi:integrase
MQFYCGGRIGEIAGLQIKNIDLENKILKIKEVIKNLPKNGKAREVHINSTMAEIIMRRSKRTPKGCVFLFHNNGEPLRYNRINVAFNKAWKKAGLSGKFSGSHLLRYSSAQAARKITGSLDAAASVTGHQSMQMAAHYGKLDSNELNQSAVIQIEKRMKEISSSRTSKKAA